MLNTRILASALTVFAGIGLLNAAQAANGADSCCTLAGATKPPVYSTDIHSYMNPAVIRLQEEAVSVPPRSFWSAVPVALRNADSGFGATTGLLHQHYVEDSSGKTLDAEHGSLPFLRLGYQHQDQHFDYGLSLRYAFGSDRYDGALQTCTASGCTVTPASATTGNKMLDLMLHMDYAFSPLPHLAILPGLFFGQHLWLRDIHGAGGYDERYSHRLFAAGLGVQYGIGPVTLALQGRYGSTFSPHLTSTLNSAKFNLGSGAWSSVGLRATWVVNPSLRLFIGDEYTGFSYGASPMVPVGGGLAVQEPHSRTQQNVIEVGLRAV